MVRFSGWTMAQILATYEEAVRDGRIALVEVAPSAMTNASMDVSMLMPPINIKVYERPPERCVERPHKKWPVRR